MRRGGGTEQRVPEHDAEERIGVRRRFGTLRQQLVQRRARDPQVVVDSGVAQVGRLAEGFQRVDHGAAEIGHVHRRRDTVLRYVGELVRLRAGGARHDRSPGGFLKPLDQTRVLHAGGVVVAHHVKPLETQRSRVDSCGLERIQGGAAPCDQSRHGEYHRDLDSRLHGITPP